MTATDDKKSAQIHEIGALLLRSPKLVGVEWDAIAYVITLSGDSGGNGTGYVYRGADDFEPKSPGQPGDTMRAFHKLRDIMTDETGDVWKQALVHITKPGPQIKMQFEYDSPDRWKPEIKGLDMTDYAMSIRPEMP